MLEPVAFPVHLQAIDVVSDAVEQRAGAARAGEDRGPFLEGKIGGDDGGAVLVALAEHVAVAIDGLGSLIDKPKWVAASPDGYAELLVWAQSLGETHAFGVEGCGSYGAGLARFLRRHDPTVHEVARPPRKGERRLCGKRAPIDAEHAARTVLSGGYRDT